MDPALQTNFRCTRYGELVPYRYVECMKKFIAHMLMFALSLSLCSCGSEREDSFHIRTWEENILNGGRALQRKEFAEAISNLESAVTEARAISKPELRLAIALDELGTAYYAVNDLQKASGILREALATYEKVKPPTKEVQSVIEDGMAKTYGTLARILMQLGSTEEADKFFMKAMSIYEQQQQKNGPSALAKREIVKLLVEIGDFNFQKHQFFTAAACYDHAMKLLPDTVGVRPYERRLFTNYRKLLKLENKSDEHLKEVMSAQDVSLEEDLKKTWKTARAYVIGRDYDNAEQLYLEALQKAEILGEVNPELIKTLIELARVYVFKGNLDKAAATLNRAVTLQKRTIGPVDLQMHKLLKGIARLQIAQKDYTSALNTLKRQWELDQKLSDADNATVGQLQNRSKMALVLHKLGQKQACDQMIAEAKQLLAQTRQGMAARNDIGRIYLERGDFANAEEMFRKVLKQTRRKQDLFPARTAKALNNMANWYDKQGKFNEAEPLYREALELMQKKPAMTRTSDYIQLVKDAASCFARIPGHEEEARELLKQTLLDVTLPTIEDAEDAEDVQDNIEGMSESKEVRRAKRRKKADDAGIW